MKQLKQLICLLLITTPFSAYAMWPWASPSNTPPASPTKNPVGLPVAATQQSVQSPSGAPITINVNVAPTQTTTTSSSAASTAQTENNTSVDTQTKLNSYLKSCVEHKDQIQAHCIQYKYYLVAGICVGLYLYLCYECIRGNMFLSGSTLWSSFKQELSFDELCNLDNALLTEDLLRSLHARYITTKDPLNTLEPMTTFLHAIEAERTQLHHFNQLYSWAKLFRVTSLLPAKAVLYDTIPARLQRLAFIKHVFVTWTCQVKLKRAYT